MKGRSFSYAVVSSLFYFCHPESGFSRRGICFRVFQQTVQPLRDLLFEFWQTVKLAHDDKSFRFVSPRTDERAQALNRIENVSILKEPDTGNSGRARLQTCACIRDSDSSQGEYGKAILTLRFDVVANLRSCASQPQRIEADSR